jgi:competence protein ComEC
MASVAQIVGACWVVPSLLVFAVVLRQRRLVFAGLIIVSCFLAGWWRGSTFAEQLHVFEGNYRKPVVLQVRALDDAIYGTQSQLTFTGGSIVLNGTQLPGKVTVSGFGLPAIFQGDVIQVEGKLSPGYGAYQGRISYGRLTLGGRKPMLMSAVKRKFNAGIETALPEPLASFSLGLLIGQRATLPDEVKQSLLMVGLTHIIAVSGYNLTIMLNASRRLLQGHSKRLNTLLSFGLMVGFIMITGGSASIIRAAIVSTLSIWAVYFGRTFKPVNLICCAAVITGMVYPFYIWGDMSWYLSFLAFYGVMGVSPLVGELLPERWKASVVIGVGLESIAAEVMTLPYILHYFGQMSLVSLPANMLVVALVPLAMLLSFIAGVVGFAAPAVAGWAALPAKLLLNYMLDITHLMSGLPHIFLENIDLALGQMLGIYIGVLVVVYLRNRQTKARKYATITDKRAIYQQGV